jgi:hypothetical protein
MGANWEFVNEELFDATQVTDLSAYVTRPHRQYAFAASAAFQIPR